MHSELPKAVAEFRTQHRKIIPASYSPYLHFIGTTCASLPLSIYAISKISQVQPLEWLTIPLAFTFASLVEYITHRTVLHRRIFPLQYAYVEHTVRHHHFYTHDAIEYEEPRDFFQVFFPVWGVVLIQYAVGLPSSLFVGMLISPNVGYLFLIVGSLFFFIYEVIHMTCHLQLTHWMFKIPGMKFLRNHHRIHHAKSRMGKYNFNVVFPLWDRILGTYITKE